MEEKLFLIFIFLFNFDGIVLYLHGYQMDIKFVTDNKFFNFILLSIYFKLVLSIFTNKKLIN